jgi:hypothetical protein
MTKPIVEAEHRRHFVHKALRHDSRNESFVKMIEVSTECQREASPAAKERSAWLLLRDGAKHRMRRPGSGRG